MSKCDEQTALPAEAGTADQARSRPVTTTGRERLHVLNLGAGIQSTCLYLMGMDGEFPLDLAIFADTGDEPDEVYQHVEWLKGLGGPEIVTVTAGNLGDNLRNGMNSTGQRHISIPTFLDTGASSPALGRRQCTSEYKIKPIEREIRRRLGAEPGGRVPAGCSSVQYFGLSFDEPMRVARVKAQYEGRYWGCCSFPLFEQFMTRADCVAYLRERIPDRQVPRSACVYCPYHSDEEWLRIKADPKAWARAVEIDEAIRDETSACVRGMNAKQYLHRSCLPLVQIEFKPKPEDKQKRMAFVQRDCEGMCGV